MALKNEIQKLAEPSVYQYIDWVYTLYPLPKWSVNTFQFSLQEESDNYPHDQAEKLFLPAQSKSKLCIGQRLRVSVSPISILAVPTPPIMDEGTLKTPIP